MKANITGNAEDAINQISRMTGAPADQVLRRALGLHLFLLEQQQSGNDVMIRDRKGLQYLTVK